MDSSAVNHGQASASAAVRNLI